MIALAKLPIADRLLVGVILALTLAVAAEAHAVCSILCIHGEAMIDQICAGRG
ncbi:hypothetical protein [Rhizobium sp. TRM95796]|uniref:hypothetical protein n=1 Tax=Rhizobium sp. TRM95796 TaxID=2979862 RepID=UPI0021E93A05|nr:hypothetical protein [Rhizobium sp. TRM95796]MCV3766562.1 hypothetical protein [Rhizobium sp. TRM95796]